MFIHSVAAVMMASLTMGQMPVSTPAPAAQQNPSQQVPASPAASSITVPTGTAIPLTLMSSVKSKSTKPGDTVRAVVAFPVTVGSRLAIPTGTFLEGTVIQVTAKPFKNQAPAMRVHFTRLLFANGYSVPLNGENTQSFLLPDDTSTQTVEVAELMPLPFPGTHPAMGAGQTSFPTAPQVGPPKGPVTGGIVGGFAAITIGAVLWARHRANNLDYIVFDVGFQFQVVLDSPVVLDSAQVAAAVAAPSAH